MEIKTRKQGEINIVEVHGDLCLGPDTETFRDLIKGLLDRSEQNILVDLSRVPMIDSSGIGTLVRCFNAARQHGGKFKLLSPSKFVRHTLEIVRVDSVFEIYDEEHKATASFLF